MELIEKQAVIDAVRLNAFHVDSQLSAINNLPTIEAIPIPKGVTNGDMIKALFPNIQFVSICSSRIYDFTTDNKIDCDLAWWNSPYKENEDATN